MENLVESLLCEQPGGRGQVQRHVDGRPALEAAEGRIYLACRNAFAAREVFQQLLAAGA